jgi:hypothetical protein
MSGWGISVVVYSGTKLIGNTDLRRWLVRVGGGCNWLRIVSAVMGFGINAVEPSGSVTRQSSSKVNPVFEDRR